MQVNKRPSILFVSGTLDIGGTEKHLSMILPELIKEGFDISIFIIGSPGKLAPLMSKTGILVQLPFGISLIERLPKKIRTLLLLLFSIISLGWFIFKHKPQVLHMFLPLPYLVGSSAAIFTKVPFKIMSRRSRNFYMSKHKLAKHVEKFFHRKTDLVIANSKEVMTDLINEGFDLKKIRLIYNGINIEDKKTFHAIRRSKRIEMGLQQNIVIIMIANIYKYKGYVNAIEAIDFLPKEIKENVVMIALGEDRGFKKEIDKMLLKLPEVDLRFLGSVPDVIPYLSVSDIALLASHEEGFSNSILDYMNASLPVVATRVGGNAEAIINGTSGHIVPPQNSKEISKRLKDLCLSVDLRVSMGLKREERLGALFLSGEMFKRIY